ncbi:MAG: hypothetical protein ACR2PT_23010 [Endozoicomonas sp.]
MKKILLAFITCFYCSSIQASPFPERRMAIHVGASAISYAIADVDPENDSIVKAHDSAHLPIPFHEDLEQNRENSLSRQIQEQALGIFRQLKNKADYYQVTKIKAVATETFRQAGNRVEMVASILGKTGIRVEIIDQETEDRLDYFTAIRTRQDNDESMIWDIGGGGYQLIMSDSQDNPSTFKGGYGSITFLNFLLEVAQDKDHRQTRNIHPLTQQQFETGLRFARHLARRTPESMASIIRKNHGQATAIGKLFQYSILPSAGSRKVSQAQLKAYIEKSLNLEATESHDDDSGRPRKGFSHLALSNAILVFGFMEELGITLLAIAERSDTDSILEYTPFWQ